MAALSFNSDIFLEKYNHDFRTSFQKLLLIYLILSMIYAFPHSNSLMISKFSMERKQSF